MDILNAYIRISRFSHFQYHVIFYKTNKRCYVCIEIYTYHHSVKYAEEKKNHPHSQMRIILSLFHPPPFFFSFRQNKNVDLFGSFSRGNSDIMVE